MKRRDQGLMLLDAMVGMLIVGMLLGVLAVALAQQQRGAGLLQTQRRLDRLAEGVLTDLQTGRPPTSPTWDTEVEPTFSIDVLPDPGPRDGWKWAEVTAQHEQRKASVVGAVPEASLTRSGGGGTP